MLFIQIATILQLLGIAPPDPHLKSTLYQLRSYNYVTDPVPYLDPLQVWSRIDTN